MPDRPHVVLLCSDEFRARSAGWLGCPLDTTPFLDSIAAGSAAFSGAHCVHPKCTPSRTSLLTGQYPHVHGHRTLDIPAGPHEPNLVRHLRERGGYETCLVGRNHCVTRAAMPGTWDHFFPSSGGFQMEPPAGHDWPVGSYLVGLDPRGPEEHVDCLNVTRAAEWAANERDRSKPALMWVNLELPHPPYAVPASRYGTIDRDAIELPPLHAGTDKPPFHAALREGLGLDAMEERHWRELVGTYHDMCRFADDRAEELVAGLKRAGMWDDTIFVFFADHGDFAGMYGLPEKWDTAFYDCLTRVPLVIGGPGVKAGRHDAIVELIDVLPTVCELVDVPMTDELSAAIHGRSTIPVMAGEADGHRDVAFCQGGQEPAMLRRAVGEREKRRPAEAYYLKQRALLLDPWSNVRAKMIFDGRWRYTFRLPREGEAPFEELYDVRSDPDELTNLARDPASAGELRRLRMRLTTKLVESEQCEPYQGYVEA